MARLAAFSMQQHTYEAIEPLSLSVSVCLTARLSFSLCPLDRKGERKRESTRENERDDRRGLLYFTRFVERALA